MPTYQKLPTRVHAFQSGGADAKNWGDLGASVDATDWVIAELDGTVQIMTDTDFTAKYTLVSGDQALTGDDVT